MTDPERLETAECKPDDDETRYVFYFDETENSQKISFYDDGGNNLTLPSCGDFFIGVFLGYESSHSEEYEEKFIGMEKKAREILNIKGDGMIKSTSLKRKRFARGAASLPEKNVEILTSFLRILDESDLKLHIVCLSKREMALKDIFQNMVLPDFVVDNSFFANMTRYAERYCDDGFYNVIRNAENPDEVRGYLITRFEEARIAAEDTGQPFNLSGIFEQMIFTILLSEFTIRNEDRYPLPYGIVFRDFRRYLEESGIDRKDVFLWIDGVEGQYEASAVGMENHDFVRSKDSASVRVCDILAGILTKMIGCLYSAMVPVELGEGFTQAMYDESELEKDLDLGWFVLDEPSFEFYLHLAHVILKNDLETIRCGDYADPVLAFQALVCYIASFGTYEEYMKKTAEDHRVGFLKLLFTLLFYRGVLAALDKAESIDDRMPEMDRSDRKREHKRRHKRHSKRDVKRPHRMDLSYADEKLVRLLGRGGIRSKYMRSVSGTVVQTHFPHPCAPMELRGRFPEMRTLR